jgi:predicted 3-demethylubiquinone-9 3-methyltransferase (glyoxalase superfamily)
MHQITPCLWFDTEGEEAAKHYTSVFPNSKIVDVARYGAAGPRPEGTVMTVSFELDGQKFVALNGGPEFTFNEAISFQVSCKTQEEVDRFWSRLSEGGEEGPCGWLKDKYGVSWQIVPTALPELLGDPDPEKSQRVMQAMLKMKKIEIGALEQAAAQGGGGGAPGPGAPRAAGGCYPAGAEADGSCCQRPNSFPCGSLQVTNQPMPGTGIGSSASPPSSFTRAAPALISSTSK